MGEPLELSGYRRLRHDAALFVSDEGDIAQIPSKAPTTFTLDFL